MKYLNFFPGNVNRPRKLSINGIAGYQVEDVESFIEHVITDNRATLEVFDGDKVRRALLDGSPWHPLVICYGAEQVEEAIREICEVLDACSSCV